MARPSSYQSSMAAETDKQKAPKKTKEERRNALGEELGRGFQTKEVSILMLWTICCQVHKGTPRLFC